MSLNDDSNTEQRLALIAEGSTLTLEQAVRELLDVADDCMRRAGVDRPPEAHGGAYLSRWRFARLRKALEATLSGAGPAAPPDIELLVTAFGNAEFDCGEWSDDDEGPYGELKDRADEARAALLRAIGAGGVSSPPAPPGPWAVLNFHREPGREDWNVVRDAHDGERWCAAGGVTEAQAIAIRDALNRVAGGASSPVSPEPTKP